VDGMASPELLVVRDRIVVTVEVELVEELESDFAGLPALAYGAPASGPVGARTIGAGHDRTARGCAPRGDRRADGSPRPSAGPPRRPLRRDSPRRRRRAPTPALRSAR